MKKIFLTFLSALLVTVPPVSFAAFDDATLTTDTVINVAGLNLNVFGSNAVIESIIVNADDFSFTLQSGSSIQVTSPDRRVLSTNAASQYIVANSCGSSGSVLKHSSTISGSVTITVTPQSSTCVGSATGASAGGGSLPGMFDTPNGPFSVVINNGDVVTQSREVNLALSAGSNVTRGGFITISSKHEDMRDAAQEKYQSAKKIDLCSKLGGLIKFPESECSEGAYTVYVKFFTSNGQPSAVFSDTIEYRKSGVATTRLFVGALSLGSTGEDVKRLQQLLNSLGFAIVSSGIGSPGNETTYFGFLTEKAVQKFQTQHGIASSGVAGFGVVGPKTVAKLNELSGTTTIGVPIQPALQQLPIMSLQFNTSLSRGMTHSDVKRLQQILNKDIDTRVANTGVGSLGNETEYFGLLTEKAVQKFQAKYGIISSGTSQATGYGLVGPKTRAKLNDILSQ